MEILVGMIVLMIAIGYFGSVQKKKKELNSTETKPENNKNISN